MAKFTLAHSNNIGKNNSNGRFLPDYLDSKFEQKLELKDSQDWERDNLGQLQIPSSIQKYIITLTCEANIMPNIIGADIGKLFNIECSHRVFAFIEQDQKIEFCYTAVTDSIIAHYELDPKNKTIQVADNEYNYLDNYGLYIKEEETDKTTHQVRSQKVNGRHQNDDSDDTESDKGWDKASNSTNSNNTDNAEDIKSKRLKQQILKSNPLYGIAEKSKSEKSMWYSYRPIIRAYLKSFTNTKENHNTSKWTLVFVEE